MTLLASALPPDPRSWSGPPAAHSTVCMCVCVWWGGWGGGGGGGGGGEEVDGRCIERRDGVRGCMAHMLGYLALE